MEICIFKYFSAEDAIVASCRVVGPKTVEVATFYSAVKRRLGVKVGIVTHSRAEVGSAVEGAMLGAEMGDVLVVDLCAAVHGGHVCEAGSTPCGVSRGVADGDGRGLPYEALSLPSPP